MKISTILVTLCICLAGCVTLSPSSSTTIPTTTAATPVIPPAIVVYNSDQLFAALLKADTTPNLRITTVAGRVYPINRPLYVRGVGTVLGGKGIIEQWHNYDGVNGGTAIIATPVFGPPEPWSPDKYVGYVWCNPVGSYNAIYEAMGYTNGGFNEPAPFQYPGPNPRGHKYTLARKILVPCEGVTIQDLTIRNMNPAADNPLAIMFAYGATVRNVTATRSWPGGRGGFGLQESEHCLIDQVFGTGIAVNSSRNCRITGITNGCGVALEEGCDSIVVDHCTLNMLVTNDATCIDNQFVACKLIKGGWEGGGYIGSNGSQRLTVANCEAEAFIGAVAQYTTGMVIVNSKALVFYGAGRDGVQMGNSWQK